jgi:aryl-alcohol dehydrogenase-like predicted oxidoreductase
VSRRYGRLGGERMTVPRSLARADGTSIPSVIVGTSRLGSVLPDAVVLPGARDSVFRYLDGVVEAGCFALDLAASYQLGGTERALGHWIASRKNRERLFLISKGGHPIPVIEPHRLTPKALASDLHASLRRLRTARIDLYLLHRDEPGAPLEPILESLVSFQQRGDIAAWGVSNWTHDRVGALDSLARASGVPTVAASSPHFSLAEWSSVPWTGCVSIAGDANIEARAFYERTQIPVLAWSPLGRGFFSKAAAGAQDRVYGGPSNVGRRERARELAQRRGVDVSHVALAYLLSQPFPVFPIVASATPERIKANLGAAELRLTQDELNWLESGSPQP